MAEKLYWGPYGQYGPFTAARDGWPDRGEVIRHYRKHVKHLSTKELARQYGEAIGTLVSERWIQKMEKENRVPQDETRRRILASILGIPPLLLGLGTLKDLLPAETPARQASTTVFKNVHPESLEIGSYDKFLNLYWKLDYTSTAQQHLDDIESIIKELYAIAPETKGASQQQVFELLCGFYPLASTIYSDQRKYSKAAQHAEDGVTLADNIDNNKMRAVALYQRGFVSLQRSRMKGDDQIDQRYLNAAIADFEAALPFAIPRVEAAILLDLALAYAYAKQYKTADVSMTKAWNIVNRGGLEDGTFVDLFANLDVGRYYLGRAAALLAMKQYEDAGDMLFEAEEGVSPDQTRRHAWIAIIQARVYLGQRNYPLATQTALSVLKTCKAIHSSTNIALIKQLHAQLAATSFGMSPSVRELGTALVLP